MTCCFMRLIKCLFLFFMQERIQIKLPMAWLSVGISNEDLCNKLIQYGILKDNQIIEAFMHTDRGDFVLDEDRYVN